MKREIIRLSYIIGEKDTQSADQFKIPQPSLIPLGRIKEGQPSNVNKLEIGLHSGTHVDAPRHFDNDGFSMDAFCVEDFIFDAPLVINVPKKPGEEISKEDLKVSEKQLKGIDLLMIRTGFSRYRLVDENKYLYEYPGLTSDASRYLAEHFNLRAIAVDLMSVENILKGRKRGFDVHKSLLCRGKKFVIIEDVNLEPLLNRKVKRVYAIPLFIREAEASPVTVFAEVI